MPSPIVIIGSINMDLVCRTRHIPRAGETILGSDFLTIPGGKGANQAVAAARLGGDVHLIARVGDDDFGQRLLSGLKANHVHRRHVTVTEGVPSGVAMIQVDRTGENAITVAPGANARLAPADIDAAEGLLASAPVVILQLEIPLPTVRHAIATCQRLGVFTILDPAPVPPKGLARALYGVDLLVPNRIEAEMLLDLSGGDVIRRAARTRKLADPKQIGIDLLARGPRAVILKLGERGSVLLDRTGHMERIKPFKVKAVDTTAAGDAFSGALAVARAEGRGLPDAARFATAAGALACTAFGAQPSLPAREAVDRLLDRR
jgi:ribokinase